MSVILIYHDTQGLNCVVGYTFRLKLLLINGTWLKLKLKFLRKFFYVAKDDPTPWTDYPVLTIKYNKSVIPQNQLGNGNSSLINPIMCDCIISKGGSIIKGSLIYLYY